MSTPDEQHDLARIDAVLAEGRATASDPRERELEELALALRDEAPQPDPAFARELDRRVEQGFARPRRLRIARFGLPPMPVLAGAAALLAAVLVAAGLLVGGDGEEREASVARDAPEGAAEPAPSIAPGSAERRVERTARMTIVAPGDEMQEVADGIGRVAEARGGYVLRSDMSTGSDTARGGTFVLRVPADDLEATLAEIGRFGDVRARSESSQDMTAPLRGVEKRLGEALLERRAMRDDLREAEGPEAAALREQLRALSAEIDELGSRREELREKTLFSTVSVSIEERE